MSGRKAKQARKTQPRPPQRRRRVTERRLAYVAAAIAVVVAVVGGIAIAHQKSNGASAEAVSGVTAASGGAPSIEGRDPITGKHVSLAQFGGKPVVLNVWASWCTGCNEEAADLARFATAHPGAQVLGVDTQDTTGAARAFYRKWHWRHPSIADPGGSLLAQLAVTGLPTTYFLDRRHRVVGRIVGAGSLRDFDRGLRLALRHD